MSSAMGRHASCAAGSGPASTNRSIWRRPGRTDRCRAGSTVSAATTTFHLVSRKRAVAVGLARAAQLYVGRCWHLLEHGVLSLTGGSTEFVSRSLALFDLRITLPAPIARAKC